MLKVGIDVSQMNSLSKGRGIGNYVDNLVDGLKKFTNVQIQLIEKGKEKNVDVLHYPFFDLYKPTLFLKGNTPTVVTVHDVTPLVFKKHYPPGIKGEINLWRQKNALKKVDAVITDSEASKKDINKYLGISNNKIFPIFLAQAERFKVIHDKNKLEDIKKKFGLPEKFALFVGNVNWNKNILGLTKACIDAGVDLCLVGSSFTKKENLNHPELKSFKEFLEKFEDNPLVHILGYVDDDEVVNLMNLAQVFIFPSYYEGFGMPVLEAQACGVPVITSNVSSLPEVAGDSALLVDPLNITEVSRDIRKVMTDKNLRLELVNKGFENIKRFSWEKCAIETAKVYMQVYEKSS